MLFRSVMIVLAIRTNHVWSITSILDLFNICDLASTMVQCSLRNFLFVMPCNCSIYCCNQLHGLKVCFPLLALFYTYIFDPGITKMALGDGFNRLIASITTGIFVVWTCALHPVDGMNVSPSYI